MSGVSHATQTGQQASANSVPVVLASDQSAIPAKFSPGLAQLTPVAVNFNSSGDNTVVAAGTGAQTVKVYQLVLVVGAATNLTFKSGAGTSLSGAMPMTASGSITLDFNGEPWYATGAAAAFVINSSNAVQVSGTAYSLTS